MKKTKLTRSLLAACSIVALSAVMYGCTGDGSENDLIATQEALEQVRADLAAANMKIERLEGVLGDETDPAADSVRGMLAAATARIGAADDPGSLLGMLDTEQKEAMRLSTLVEELETELGDPTTPDPASVRGMLNTATDLLKATNTRIGSVDDPTSLLGMLNAEQKKAEMYRVAIQGDGTDANPGLQAELNAAKKRINTLLAGEDPDQLAPIAGGAGEVGTGARNSATNAGTDADAAETASENRATIQTGEANSVEHAENARMYATTADLEATKAEGAAENAKNAKNVADQNRYLVAAETAKNAADEAAAKAKSERDEAVADSMVELKIDGTVKSVGDTEIDDTAAEFTSVLNGNTTKTGLQKTELIQTAGPMIAGTPDDTNTPLPADESLPGAEARTFDIGKVVDSVGDDARLAIVTQYAGTDTVTAYEDNTGVTRMGTAENMITYDHDADGGTTAEVTVSVGKAGDFYLASGLTENDTITAATMASPISYYDNADGDVNGDDERTYVRLTGSTANQPTAGTTTYSYQVVDIKMGATIPAAADYSYIHFGVWSGLEAADSAGDNDVADLGIGFVQNHSGSMTESMPIRGTVAYNGNWVANVQEKDAQGAGDITRMDGVATMMANFSKGEVDVTLAGLATLEGTIDGNTFSGDADAAILAGMHGMDVSADFEGSMDGAFFGPIAVEAGGVFDYSSDGDKGGAFRGAFGGVSED